MLRLPIENTLDREEKIMAEWITTTLEECTDILGDGLHGTPKYTENGEYAFVNGNNLVDGEILIKKETKRVDYSQYDKYKKPLTNRTILVSINGTLGNVGVYGSEKIILGKSACYFNVKESVDKDFIYYIVSSPTFKQYLESNATGTTIKNISLKQMREYTFELPEIGEQKRISSVLRKIDEKIKNNRAINNNLLEQVLTLYRNRFVDTANNERRICRADEYFDISIGKTPPRKEPQWFSTNPQDVTWVSISDMGTCGLYISSSSEQLTKEAVDRHNVKIVPDNTVLLSFKLTVGRIAITNGEMTTNEAIAHFKTDKKEINEYLYCYLKCFNYQTMGSTSSIATAVNSKIIKGMPFVVPTDDELIDFHSVAAPMFAKIKVNQTESEKLTAVRDTLLPKLMSGELDVSDIEL